MLTHIDETHQADSSDYLDETDTEASEGSSADPMDPNVPRSQGDPEETSGNVAPPTIILSRGPFTTHVYGFYLSRAGSCRLHLMGF